jgi:hypothetical protein
VVVMVVVAVGYIYIYPSFQAITAAKKLYDSTAFQSGIPPSLPPSFLLSFPSLPSLPSLSSSLLPSFFAFLPSRLFSFLPSLVREASRADLQHGIDGEVGAPAGKQDQFVPFHDPEEEAPNRGSVKQGGGDEVRAAELVRPLEGLGGEWCISAVRA